MAVLLTLLCLLLAACVIASLVCFIIVVVKMFQHGDVTMAIFCIVMVLTLAWGIGPFLTTGAGIGPLLAFIIGWIKADEWEIEHIMMIWTGCFIGAVVLAITAIAIAAATGTNVPGIIEISAAAWHR